MFIPDNAIETEKDDFLNRKGFSQHLGESLLDWKERESLIIAIHGEWGSGKSSAINLMSEYIQKKEVEDKPTIIEFNPWIYSEQDNLSEHFFNEIARELQIKKDSDVDVKIAEKLLYYSRLLSLTPDENIFSSSSSKVILGLGLLLGISASKIIDWFNSLNDWIKYLLVFLGVLIILKEILKNYSKNLAVFFNKKSDYSKKSILEVKEEIKAELRKRQKKLIIVIDDIDRLNQSEIKHIFRLIRINADFPNMIYLLAFDRNIIEKNLEEQAGVSGKDYLKKIVQVDFDIPFAKPSKISDFFFVEYNRILSVLPESAQGFYGQDSPYWANIYNSGLKDFFKTIRDVKRFMSSLEFNISQMYQGEIMEVNPIDFTAIEAIRVFAPDFYSFMKSRNFLFTSTDGLTSVDSNMRMDEIKEHLDKLPVDTREPTNNLIETLFPQVLTKHGYGSQFSWGKNLRVCATSYFDSYFTLIPGGDEEEISQYEMENILSKTNSVDEFEAILRNYMDKNKIRKVLQKIQDYTSSEDYISQEDAKNVVLALFNISDDLPDEKSGMFDFGADMDIMRIIHQIFQREHDKHNNFEILKDAIPLSKGLYGPVEEVSLNSPRENEDNGPNDIVVPEDKMEELQKLCLEKIIGWQDKLLDLNEFIYVMYRWREWDEELKWKGFIENILMDDENLLAFVGKFITEKMSHTLGDYASKITKQFNYKNLRDFVDIENIKSRLEKIKNENNDLYKENKQTIDFYLENYDKQDLF